MVAIALGTAQFGLDYGIANSDGKVTASEVAAILELAWDGAVRWLDTAAAYGDAEAVVAAMRTAANFQVCTKIGASGATRPDELARELEASLAELQRSPNTKATSEVASVRDRPAPSDATHIPEVKTLLRPIFFFFLFHCHIELYRIETHYFKTGSAVRALDDIALVSVFIDLHFSLAFGADSSWHTLHSSVVILSCPLPRIRFEATKNLNRNPQYLQEAI